MSKWVIRNKIVKFIIIKYINRYYDYKCMYVQSKFTWQNLANIRAIFQLKLYEKELYIYKIKSNHVERLYIQTEQDLLYMYILYVDGFPGLSRKSRTHLMI